MTDRSNVELNALVEETIYQWDGTAYGVSLKNMYENGTSYEGICDFMNIDYEDYMED